MWNHFTNFFLFQQKIFQALFKIDVVQRNGTDIMIINDLPITLDASHFEMDFKYQNVPIAITRTISATVNLNWKFFKPLLGPFITRFMGGIFREYFFQPIFTKMIFRNFSNSFSTWIPPVKIWRKKSKIQKETRKRFCHTQTSLRKIIFFLVSKYLDGYYNTRPLICGRTCRFFDFLDVVDDQSEPFIFYEPSSNVWIQWINYIIFKSLSNFYLIKSKEHIAHWLELFIKDVLEISVQSID